MKFRYVFVLLAFLLAGCFSLDPYGTPYPTQDGRTGWVNKVYCK